MSGSTNKSPGFTLIEVLVSIAIMTIGLITVVSIFPFSIRANKSAERQSLASSYARTKLEQLLTIAYDSVGTGTIEARARISNDPQNPAYTLERQTMVTLVDSNLNNSGTDVGLKKIQVTIFWSNRQGGDNSLVLTSILGQK